MKRDMRHKIKIKSVIFLKQEIFSKTKCSYDKVFNIKIINFSTLGYGSYFLKRQLLRYKKIKVQ